MNWVSIKDGYPEEDKEVLVTNGIDQFHLAQYSTFLGFIDSSECWDIEGVTHWCKLVNAIVYE